MRAFVLASVAGREWVFISPEARPRVPVCRRQNGTHVASPAAVFPRRGESLTRRRGFWKRHLWVCQGGPSAGERVLPAWERESPRAGPWPWTPGPAGTALSPGVVTPARLSCRRCGALLHVLGACVGRGRPLKGWGPSGRPPELAGAGTGCSEGVRTLSWVGDRGREAPGSFQSPCTGWA